MDFNQSSHFRYGASFEIIDKVPVMETIMSSYTQDKFHSTSLKESSIEFNFETDCNLNLDLLDTNL